MSPAPTIEEIIERLTHIMDEFEADGFYVKANSIWLAIEALRNKSK